MGIEAVFKFFANNAASIAITGAILMFLVGASMKGAGLQGADDLFFWAPIVFIGGIALQVFWLKSKKQ